jgi:hypothetical protein
MVSRPFTQELLHWLSYRKMKHDPKGTEGLFVEIYHLEAVECGSSSLKSQALRVFTHTDDDCVDDCNGFTLMCRVLVC